MKQLLLVLIFFVAGCAGDDKNASADNADADANVDGKRLFNSMCISCHKPDEDFTGPALKGSLQRWGGDKKAMYAIIRNPMESVQKNAYAKKVFEKWNKTQMTAFPLSDTQIDAIMKYVETGK